MGRKQSHDGKGKLIIIGGKEDKEGDCEILEAVAREVGNGKLCIVSVASTVGDELWDIYKRVFKNLGVKKLSHLDVVQRTHKFDEKAYKAVKDATAIFFTGGDQLKITSEIGGTIIQDRISEIYKSGGVIAGTSAGASVMGDTMMISGSSDASYRINSGLKMAPGLGFAKNMLIDQHFAERGRIGRLLGATAHNPKFLGIGIDENTAIVLQDKSHFDVIGDGAVYVLDAHEANGSNVSEAEDLTALSIFDVKLHVLVKGNHFDLVRKVASPKAP